jgi:Spy/CpxP family protein refolding chaperone
MSFLTFHISMFFSASFCCGALMAAMKRNPQAMKAVGVCGGVGQRQNWCESDVTRRQWTELRADGGKEFSSRQSAWRRRRGVMGNLIRIKFAILYFI